ncbi:hypothetical protein [Spiroplasma floricola]|uniref:Uncharacterized protein n=1 Tax=Spiroplasma floricola 23-6 TaxID=1336749 RepID=A0A2K8SDA2_9MOLU|nr:hypothetical protein [Spiroplasma floricola]AUB31403.1 hypothetical protein SFLOR_v1c03460 [Spiroplasma floricola 23-6]
MKEIDKQSIFWFGLHNLVQENAQLKYYITTQKELIYNLYPVVYLGVIQYSLYRGIVLEEIPLEDSNSYTDYILERYEEIYKIRYRFVKDKPKKANLKDIETYQLCEEIISDLLLPYINEYCFRTYDMWKNLVQAYIRECTINYEYDINHKSDDGKTKTSMLYPFFFTLSLIAIEEKQGLYQRIEKCYKKEVLLRKFNSGREWKEKELDYLSETYELIKNDEEWLLFLSNFSSSKWDNFDLKERFKALFQLTKLTTILMKDEISAVTMLDDGEELFDQVKNYLPLFIFEDKIFKKENELKRDLKNSEIKVLSPFANQNINIEVLIPYIETKGERFVNYNKATLVRTSEIIYTVLAKLRLILLIHEYLPSLIDSRIWPKKKLFVDVLNLFEEQKEGKFKRILDVENLLVSDFLITEDNINEVLELKYTNIEDFYNKAFFYKIGKIMSLMLGVESTTASKMNYDLGELFKNIIILMGPHPLDHTVQTNEVIEKLYSNFKNMCFDYEKMFENNIQKSKNYISNLELPLKLLRWKKD